MPTPNHMSPLGPLFAPAWHRPWLRYFAPVDGDAGPAGDNGDDGDGANDDAVVPVAERPQEEQTAYWRGESKKQQKVRDKYAKHGTPDEIAAKLAELESLKKGPQTDDDKQKAADRDAAEQSGAKKILESLAPQAITMALIAHTKGADESFDDAHDRVEKAIKFADISKFLTADGEIDPDAVQTYAESLGSGAPQQQQGDPLNRFLGGQQQPKPGQPGSVAATREAAYEANKPKPKK